MLSSFYFTYKILNSNNLQEGKKNAILAVILFGISLISAVFTKPNSLELKEEETHLQGLDEISKTQKEEILHLTKMQVASKQKQV